MKVSVSGGVRRRRLKAALAGLGVAVLVIGLIQLTRPLGSRPRPTPNAARQKTGLPQGKLLLGETLVSPQSAVSVDVDIAWSISSDGTRIVGADLVQGPGSLSRPAELVMVDLSSGRRSILARVGAREWLGPAKWSADATTIAYQKSACPTKPDKVFCRVTTQDTVCTLHLETTTSKCLPQVGQVYSFNWSPDGRLLLVAGPGRLPVQLLDPETGSVSTLLSPGGTESVRRGLDAAFHGKADAFVLPVWSASGRFVAALASVTGGDAVYVPIVVDLEGRLIAMGQPSTEFQPGFGWSPAKDVLAYTTGKAPYTTTGIRELDVATGEDRRLLDTTAKRSFDVTGLAWSPSGRWLAVSRSEGGALIIEATGREAPVELSGGEVKGWAW